MIFASPADIPAQSVRSSRFKGEGGESTGVGIYQPVQTAVESSSFAFSVGNLPETNFEQISSTVRLVEDFDWTDAKLEKDFIKHEQKALAGKATESELERYNSMKASRDSIIFSKRYLENYAEIQRLNTLSSKIAEIQKFLKPIKLG